MRILVNGKRSTRRWPATPATAPTENFWREVHGFSSYERTMLYAKVLWSTTTGRTSAPAPSTAESFDHAPELDEALPDSARVAAELEGHFLEDVEVSKEFELEAWKKRPLRQRLAECVAGLRRQSL